jgi:hypothetical protein
MNSNEDNPIIMKNCASVIRSAILSDGRQNERNRFHDQAQNFPRNEKMSARSAHAVSVSGDPVETG